MHHSAPAPRRSLLRSAVVVAAVVLTGCAGATSVTTSRDAMPATPVASDTATAASTAPATRAPSSTASEAPSGPATHGMAGHSMAPDTIDIVIEDFAFAPESVEVAAGTTVTWSNRDGEPHSVRAEDGSITSKLIVGGSPFEWIADGASGTTIAYFCGIHPAMKGTVEIR